MKFRKWRKPELQIITADMIESVIVAKSYTCVYKYGRGI